MNYHSKERVWGFIQSFYRQNKTTPTIRTMLTTLEFDREKLRRALRGLVEEGYIRESRIKNRKFFVMIRGGEYIP